MGDAERPPLAEAMDRSRAGQKVDGAIELAPLNAFTQSCDRGRRRIGEAKQEMGRIAAVAGVLLQRPEPLGIVRPAVAEAPAKHLLQVGKAREAERLGEAHQGRSLHVGAAREGGSGAERELIGMLERICRGLTKALRKMRLDLDQAALQRVEALRRLRRRVVTHRSPSRAGRLTCARRGIE